MTKLILDNKKRCAWATADALYRNYHDTEWGVPLYDEHGLFEFLILEGMQAGLSWITILRKRENYRQAFDHFDAEKIVRYNKTKVAKLLMNPGIIRNRLKVEAIIQNARAFLELKEEKGDFADYIWQFVDHKPILNRWKKMSDVPATSPLSDTLSKDLKKRGFKFIGSTICYAYMQAVGMVNDHLTCCFRYPKAGRTYR